MCAGAREHRKSRRCRAGGGWVGVVLVGPYAQAHICGVVYDVRAHYWIFYGWWVGGWWAYIHFYLVALRWRCGGGGFVDGGRTTSVVVPLNVQLQLVEAGSI